MDKKIKDIGKSLASSTVGKRVTRSSAKHKKVPSVEQEPDNLVPVQQPVRQSLDPSGLSPESSHGVFLGNGGTATREDK